MDKNINITIRRFIAYIIDWFIGGMLVILPIFVVNALTGISLYNTTLNKFSNMYQLLIIVLALILSILYYAILPYLWNGQTIGKKILKIQIVSKDNKKLTIKQLMIREVVGIFLLEGNLYVISSIIRSFLEAIVGFNIILILSVLMMIITLTSCIVVLLNRQHLALHDVISKTQVCHI